ncbi:2-Hydroxyacid oxidase 1-like [Symsagittifera roscoffensis]|uniref:2-Hydroxyacid oxidase 1-like n=1 Tax=Symsagittifera roscoffensis TaxID=84072 RepID=UPI00307CB927
MVSSKQCDFSPLVCLSDFEREARNILPRNALNYYKSGADEEHTLADNVAAFRRLRLIPRVLRDVEGVSLQGHAILGQIVSSPICVAPTAMQKMAHGQGELATARACAKKGTLMALSTLTTVALETIAEEVPTLHRWLQLYIYKDLEATLDVVRRAEKNGFSVVAVTVDTPFLGKRREDERHKFTLPSHLALANFADQKNDREMYKVEGGGGKEGGGGGGRSGLSKYVDVIQNHSLTWKHIAWLRSHTSMKIVLKGIHSGEDARLAVEAGVDAIWVSNHGGRQLDTVPATIEMLPDIVRAVRSAVAKKKGGAGSSGVEVFVDGGVRTGTDVLKALALGANAVFIGRPVLWGLACGGEEGVSRVLEILNEELRLSMALSGCRTLSDVTKDLVRHQSSFSNL